MDVDRILESLATLTLADLQRVYAAVGARIRQHAATQQPAAEAPAAVQPQKYYRQEYVRCQKVGCKTCAPGGPGHGPYWYCYYTEGGRRHKRYIGKKLPPGVDV